jgi:hypothetical protein
MTDSDDRAAIDPAADVAELVENRSDDIQLADEDGDTPPVGIWRWVSVSD